MGLGDFSGGFSIFRMFSWEYSRISKPHMGKDRFSQRALMPTAGVLSERNMMA